MVSPYHLSLYTDMESIVGENNTGTNISVQKDLHRSTIVITMFPIITTLAHPVAKTSAVCPVSFLAPPSGL